VKLYLPSLVGIAILSTLLVSCSNDIGENFPDQGTKHIPDNETYTEYASTPPTSGPHWNAAAPWGIYSKPLPNERQVHNLEHGGIILQYNTDDQAIKTSLIRFAQKQQTFPCFIIVAPYPTMPFKIAATAWRVRETLDTYDEVHLQKFFDSYQRKGPERVPCSAGGQMIR
jgi:hypothetical protein